MHKLRFCTSCNLYKEPVHVALVQVVCASCNSYKIGSTRCNLYRISLSLCECQIYNKNWHRIYKKNLETNLPKQYKILKSY